MDRFEYMYEMVEKLEQGRLNTLGASGWELSGIATGGYKFLLVYKRKVQDNEPQFKPFDKVLVRVEDGFWMARLYDRYYLDKHWCQDGICWKECIPYEGNQELVGTCNEPKCK